MAASEGYLYYDYVSTEARKGPKDLNYYLDLATRETVNLKTEERAANSEIVKTVTKKITDYLQRNDDTFGACFERILPVGSYHENLKVGSANEFDYDLTMKAPTSRQGSFLEHPTTPGYIMYKLESYHNVTVEARRRKEFMDEDNYLIPGRLFSWFYGIVVKALDNLKREGDPLMQRVFLRAAEPAVNLIIDRGTSQEISLDLAPTIPMEGEPPGLQLPSSWSVSHLISTLRSEMMSKSLWQITAKQYPQRRDVSPTKAQRLWRISTAPLEKRFLSKIDNYGNWETRASLNGCRKQVLRLLKTLRECEGSNWLAIKSFHLKTLVLQECKQREDWSHGKLGECFIGVLRRLQESLRQQKLSDFFFPEQNLFANLDWSTASNLNYRVDAIIRKFERSPEKVMDIFK
ncbi:cyclic GMP-AMP synthase-like receptor 1 [Glandiceps talaboti]